MGDPSPINCSYSPYPLKEWIGGLGVELSPDSRHEGRLVITKDSVAGQQVNARQYIGLYKTTCIIFWLPRDDQILYCPAHAKYPLPSMPIPA